MFVIGLAAHYNREDLKRGGGHCKGEECVWFMTQNIIKLPSHMGCLRALLKRIHVNLIGAA